MIGMDVLEILQHSLYLTTQSLRKGQGICIGKRKGEVSGQGWWQSGRDADGED